MIVAEIEKTLMDLAREYVDRGPGFAQEGVVLRAVRERLDATDLAEEQRILNVWHRLFAEGKLVWGYDLDSPGRPFFHIPD